MSIEQSIQANSGFHESNPFINFKTKIFVVYDNKPTRF